MKIISVGDIHGRKCWKDISMDNEFDKFVFIGDYFDSFSIYPHHQIDNFKDILAFKRSYPEKVVLLFGNHDYHYLKTSQEQYTGFLKFLKTDIAELLHKAIDDRLVQMCFIYNEFVFTHAGITKTWAKNNSIDLADLQNSINDLFYYKPNSFKDTKGSKMCRHGDEVTQNPIWVRPNSLFADGIDNCVQVVGHTEREHILLKRRIIVDGRPVERDDIILIDTLGDSGEFLVIEDGIMSVSRTRVY